MTTVFLVIWLAGQGKAAVSSIPMESAKACEAAALAVHERRNLYLSSALTYCIDPRTGKVWP